jgi:hypothetical protein
MHGVQNFEIVPYVPCAAMETFILYKLRSMKKQLTHTHNFDNHHYTKVYLKCIFNIFSLLNLPFLQYVNDFQFNLKCQGS